MAWPEREAIRDARRSRPGAQEKKEPRSTCPKLPLGAGRGSPRRLAWNAAPQSHKRKVAISTSSATPSRTLVENCQKSGYPQRRTRRANSGRGQPAPPARGLLSWNANYRRIAIRGRLNQKNLPRCYYPSGNHRRERALFLAIAGNCNRPI